MSSLLTIEGLNMTLGDFRMGPLSLTLERGDYLVLLGPSGCGKTSLLRAIAGVYDAPPGKMLLDGGDVGTLAPHKRRIGYVAQAVDLFPHISVARNVLFGLKYVKATPDEKRAGFGRIVDLLGLSSLLHRAPATLSGGESKRAALARSLVVNPRILLLDEPLSMLDYNARAGMLDILKMIHDELGTATIHVTHDREEAWTLGGRCAVMRDGNIEQTGRVEELFRRPASRFVAEFLGGSNIFPARFERSASGCRAILDWAEFDLDAPVGREAGYAQIRPESLAPAREGGRGAINGTIRSISDRGIYMEVRVEIAGGERLVAHLTGADCEGLKVGESVRLECRTPPHPIEE